MKMESLKETASQLEQYDILRTNIFLMKKEQDKQLKSLVNIGSEVYAQAKTPDRKHIFINIGLGFHVEFTLDEALAFIDKKIKKLEMYRYEISHM